MSFETLEDMVGYEITCKVSEEYKNDPEYNGDEFVVIISKNDKNEYKAVIRGETESEVDAETAGKKIIIFGDWIVTSYKKV